MREGEIKDGREGEGEVPPLLRVCRGILKSFQMGSKVYMNLLDEIIKEKRKIRMRKDKTRETINILIPF